MEVWVSKKYKTSKLTKQNVSFNDFVDVFEDKVIGWYLDWAREANRYRHAGFISLHIGFSYFEAISNFMNGNKDVVSRKGFMEQFQRIFYSDLEQSGHEIKAILKFMYKEGRCGFYHSGMAKKGLILEDGSPTIRIKPGDVNKFGHLVKVRIDRHSFIDRIMEDFKSYIIELRDPINIRCRDNFMKSWNKIHYITIAQNLII